MILRTLGVAKLRSCAHGPSENCLSFLTCQFCGADCVEHPRRVDSNIPPKHPTSYYSFWVRWNISVNCLNLKGRTHGESLGIQNDDSLYMLRNPLSALPSISGLVITHQRPTCRRAQKASLSTSRDWATGSHVLVGEALAGLGSGPCQICQGALQRIDHHGFKNWSHRSHHSGLIWTCLACISLSFSNQNNIFVWPQTTQSPAPRTN